MCVEAIKARDGAHVEAHLRLHMESIRRRAISLQRVPVQIGAPLAGRLWVLLLPVSSTHGLLGLRLWRRLVELLIRGPILMMIAFELLMVA